VNRDLNDDTSNSTWLCPYQIFLVFATFPFLIYNNLALTATGQSAASPQFLKAAAEMAFLVSQARFLSSKSNSSWISLEEALSHDL
jgi:hypothetical protein